MDVMKSKIAKFGIYFISIFMMVVFSSALEQKERITIYTIGDSTMADKDTVGNPERGWGQALPLYFDAEKVRIENHAKNGRSTKSFIDEGRWDAVVDKLKKGDYVFIQFGHNDEKRQSPDRYTDPRGAYKANLTRFVNETRVKGAYPVLMSPIVRRHFDESGHLIDTHGEYPEAVRQLSEELNVPFIDMESKSRKMIERLGPEDSKRLFVWFEAGEYPRFPEGKQDDTHLNWEGAVSVAGLAVEGLRELNLPVSRYLKEENQVILFGRNRTTYVYANKKEKEVVHTAISLLQKDVEEVFGGRLEITEDPDRAAIVVGDLLEEEGGWETFKMETQEKKSKRQLVIRGSDARGKAYGILELSRLIGVSPWVYFADVRPVKRELFIFPEVSVRQSPSVRYRGIFLNDEDWGLMPWATKTMTPGTPLVEGIDKGKGAIGPDAYAKIFEVLLRLRANTIWPAMHECTVPFYFVQGNKEMADKHGIVVGTSHCEPMMRNSASEWDIAGKGEYNFLTNRENVLNYWAERLKELRGSENIFTIGMRGKHDGKMEGVKTVEEYKNALSQVIPAQQELLRKYIDSEPEKVPQIFVPYKEVLEVYDAGLEVPDCVTLVWCDDNYGYIRRLSNEKERQRGGRSGIYYHISYWGRPHDYLWLATTSPALIYTEMKRAYEHGADRLWILNVGDLKPGEYLTEFFLDMAWDIHFCEHDSSVFSHLERWAEREFGKKNAKGITVVMKEYYRLGTIRKPEFMGWSRVEEPGYGRGGITPVRDTEYNPDFNNELQRRIDDYRAIEKQVSVIKGNMADYKKSAFFQLVEYPVRGSSLMNRKWLYAQLARQYSRLDIETAKKYADASLEAYYDIRRITEEYDRMENGKWKYMMNFHPRDLPVFGKPDFRELDSLINVGYKPISSVKDKMAERPFVLAKNASQAIEADRSGKIIEGLGHSFSAVQMRQGELLTFTFEIPASGEYWIKIGTLPNHDVDGQGMKIALSIEGKDIGEFDYRTIGRSETWKENVLRGQAVTTVDHYFSHPGKVTISVKALTPYIILDQIMIGQGPRNFYEFPVR
jgi:lysophospholipase L1-like esterase